MLRQQPIFTYRLRPVALSPGQAGRCAGSSCRSVNARSRLRYTRGETYSAIATALSLSPATVRNHIAHCFKKLGVSNKLELVSRLERKA
jgi:hypothetical protein